MNEILVCQIWHAQWLLRDQLRTRDGRSVRVIFRGHWSAGDGPDFQDALIVLDDGPLLRGAVEVHVRATEWAAHGHDGDPAYDAVILHVTFDESEASCLRSDGTMVAHLPLRPYLPGTLEQFPPTQLALNSIAPAICPARLAGVPSPALRGAVQTAGQARLLSKAASAEASLWMLGVREAVYRGLLDALGYSRNRAQMASLADRLPLALLEDCQALPEPSRTLRLAALLLGSAGFLPWSNSAGLALDPAFMGRVEKIWAGTAPTWTDPSTSPIIWDVRRVRPTNHPARRLLGLAVLLSQFDLAAFPLPLFDLLHDYARAPRQLVAALTARLWPDASGSNHRPTLIGTDRATDIVSNILLPYGLAYARIGGDEQLASAVHTVAGSLRAGAASAHMRIMHEQLGGHTSFPVRTAQEQQGLVHLYRSWCRMRRCYECPIARLCKPDGD